MNGPDRSWVAAGACVGLDPEIFYPARGGSTAKPKSVCRGCIVRDSCLEYALATGEKFGIWGGRSERERRRLRRARAIAGRSAAAVGSDGSSAARVDASHADPDDACGGPDRRMDSTEVRRDASSPTSVRVPEPELDEAPVVALEWVDAALDRGDVATAWSFTAEGLRRRLVERWVARHLDELTEEPGPVVAALAADDPDHVLWATYAAWQAQEWRSTFPADLRASSPAWALLARAEPVAPGLATAVFVRTDGLGDREQLPPGLAVPARRILLEADVVWRVAGLDARALDAAA